MRLNEGDLVQFRNNGTIETVKLTSIYGKWAQGYTKNGDSFRRIGAEDFANGNVWQNVKPEAKPFSLPTAFVTGRSTLLSAVLRNAAKQ